MNGVAIDMAKRDLPKHVYADKYPDGRLRIRFRKKGQQSLTLAGPINSKPFWLAYAKALEGVGAPAAAAAGRKPGKAAPGSFRATCEAYFARAPQFRRLDPETQRVRRRVFESMWGEPLKPGSELIFANCPLKTMTAKHVRALRDRKLDTPEAANHRLKALGPFFDWAVEEDLISSNPVRDVKRFARATGGHHSWTVEEVAQFEARHPTGTKARLALTILMLTGLRISDVCKLGPKHAKDGWFSLTVHKNRNIKPVELDLPILADLQTAIDATPCGPTTYLVTDYGKPFSIKGLGQKMRQWCDEAGLPKCSAHGLRKAAAAIVAERGATDRQMMAIFGWSDSKQASVYTEAARKKVLAGSAMHLLGAEREPKSYPPISQAPPSGKFIGKNNDISE